MRQIPTMERAISDLRIQERRAEAAQHRLVREARGERAAHRGTPRTSRVVGAARGLAAAVRASGRRWYLRGQLTPPRRSW